MIGAPNAQKIIKRRRPMRSASAASGSEMTTPQRMIAAPMPCPCSEIAKSCAAYATVCVNNVLAYVAGTQAKARSHKIVRWREVNGGVRGFRLTAGAY